MELSLVGALVCLTLILVGLHLGASVITTFMMSLTFGATAVVTLPAMGGASPLVYTVFAGLVIGAAALRRKAVREVVAVFQRHWEAWVVMGLCIYALSGAFILPRLFHGMVTVFVAERGSGYLETPLAPTAGNLTHSFYLLLGGLVFVALCMLLRQRGNVDAMRRGFFAWAILHTAFGIIDLGSKHLGAGDILAPLRTATYAMLTNVHAADFFRIAGSYPEASAFGGFTLSILAFTLTYWRSTGSMAAFVLSCALTALLFLSTSTAAYGGAALMSVLLLASIVGTAVRHGPSRQDMVLAFAFLIALTAALALHLRDPQFFDPAVELIDTVVLNKASSASAAERGYWNERSIHSIFDTAGLGVGIGSSRASGWIIAVLSQLGVTGALLMALLVGSLIRGAGGGAAVTDHHIAAFVCSVRACALALLVSASLISGSADPGIVFFIALAVVVTTREESGRYAAGFPATPALALRHTRESPR
jgi:hypothetical protein